MITLFKYYGSDLMGMVMLLSSMYFIGSKKRFGFIFGIIGNLSFLFFGILTKSTPVIFTNVVLVILNIRGFIKWKKIKTSPNSA